MFVPMPMIVYAVLLCFKDRVITDGLASVIPVRSGWNYTLTSSAQIIDNRIDI